MIETHSEVRTANDGEDGNGFAVWIFEKASDCQFFKSSS